MMDVRPAEQVEISSRACGHRSRAEMVGEAEARHTA